jgi:ankyrin repeat protein
MLCYKRPIKSQRTGEKIVRRGFAGAAAALIVALSMMMGAPATAQQYSDSYSFLKAVKDRDGAKATSLISVPGTTIINTRGGGGEGALHILVRDRDSTWLSFLLGQGARPDLQNDQGETPLSLAAQIGWVDGARMLLDHKAMVDLGNRGGETPLIMAVRNRDLAMVRLLLAYRANPRKTDTVAGYSAIDYARQDPRAAPLLRVLDPEQATARP